MTSKTEMEFWCNHNIMVNLNHFITKNRIMITQCGYSVEKNRNLITKRYPVRNRKDFTAYLFLGQNDI